MLQVTKIALFPTDERRQKLAVQSGCARYVWDKALRMKKTAWQERQQSLSCYAIKALLPQWKRAEATGWLSEADDFEQSEPLLTFR